MRVLAVSLILLSALLAGCVTVEDKNQTDDPDEPPAGKGVDAPDDGDGSDGDPEPDPEPEPDDADELKGGDTKDDTSFREDVGVAPGAPWKKMDHHFRVPIKISSNAEVGEEYRFTIDVGAALQDAGLRWLHPGTPLAELDPDATSVVVHQVSSAGIVQSTVAVESRQAGTHAIEVAFEHVGGNYIVYFDDERNDAEGEQHTLFPDAQDITAFRGKAQWQGDDLWGLTYFGDKEKNNVWPGDTVIMYATIQNDNREHGHGAVPLEFALVARAPADWDDVEVDPEGGGEVQNNRRVSLRGVTPEDATGSDTVHLDVIAEGRTVTATFLVRYHQT